MAMFVRQRVGMRRTGSSCTVPDNPRAKLMYYLHCVSTVLELDNPNLQRLTNYQQYYLLSDTEETSLFFLVLLLSPDELIGKVFFPSDQLCPDSNNAFYEISQVNHLFGVHNNVLIGGEQKRVNKIMTFKRAWMDQNYLQPIQQMHARREQARQRQRSNACAIM